MFHVKHRWFTYKQQLAIVVWRLEWRRQIRAASTLDPARKSRCFPCSQCKYGRYRLFLRFMTQFRSKKRDNPSFTPDFKENTFLVVINSHQALGSSEAAFYGFSGGLAIMGAFYYPAPYSNRECIPKSLDSLLMIVEIKSATVHSNIKLSAIFDYL